MIDTLDQKEVYICFHYNSGFARLDSYDPTTNKGIMEMLQKHLSNKYPTYEFYFPHFLIDSGSTNEEAMWHCAMGILTSGEVWWYEIEILQERESDGEILKTYPFKTDSENIAFEKQLATITGIPLIEKKFPTDTQEYIQILWDVCHEK